MLGTQVFVECVLFYSNPQKCETSCSDTPFLFNVHVRGWGIFLSGKLSLPSYCFLQTSTCIVGFSPRGGRTQGCFSIQPALRCAPWFSHPFPAQSGIISSLCPIEMPHWGCRWAAQTATRERGVSFCKTSFSLEPQPLSSSAVLTYSSTKLVHKNLTNQRNENQAAHGLQHRSVLNRARIND